MMTYEELQKAIAFYIHRTDLAGQYPLFVDLAREYISKDARFSYMIEILEVTSEEGPVDLPEDYLEVHSITRPGYGALKKVTRQQLEQLGSGERSARHYAIEGRRILFKPNAVAGLEIAYYARPGKLISNADTNSILTNYPSLYLFASLKFAASAIQDYESEAVYTSNYNRALDDARSSEIGAQSSGDTPQIRGF
jgi:hypothetical protein